MASLLAWSMIIFIDIFSILFGIYFAYKFIRVFLDGGDLIKNQGTLISSFLFIFVMPFFITFGGLMFADSYEGKYSLIGLDVKVNGLNGVNGRISLEPREFNSGFQDEMELGLNVVSDDEEVKELFVDVYCQDEVGKCDDVVGMLILNEDRFVLEPKVSFELPIVVNIKDGIPSGEYNFNISVFDSSNLTFDSTVLTVSIN